MQQLKHRVAPNLLDPFNAFVHRGSLKKHAQRQGRLQDWKVAVKDNISVKGWPLTCASKALASFQATYNADVIEALLREGAEIVGKTNLDEFGMGSRCERSIFGPTLNPRDSSKSAGGSSGGSAAAVAANLARIGIGSDTGGSVRLPASYCGLVGFKPSWGVLSRFGLVSYAPSLDTVGILTKTVQDCIDAFEVMRVKQSDKDSTVKQLLAEEISTEQQIPLEGLLIGVFDSWLRKLPSSHPLSKVLDHLDNQNCRLVLLKSNSFGLEDESFLDTYYKIASMEASSTLARYTGMFWDGQFTVSRAEAKNCSQRVAKFQEENFSKEVLRRVSAGRMFLSDPTVVEEAVKERARIKEAFNSVFRHECDLIIGPTAFDSAPSLQKSFESERSDDIFTVSANLADLPAISLPLHGTEAIGTQLMGPNRNDLFLLRVARSLEESFFAS